MKPKIAFLFLFLFSINSLFASSDNKTKTEEQTEKFMNTAKELILGNFGKRDRSAYKTHSDIIVFQKGLARLIKVDGIENAGKITEDLHRRSWNHVELEKRLGPTADYFTVKYLKTEYRSSYLKAFGIYNSIYPKVVKQHPNLIGKIDSPLEILSKAPWIKLNLEEARKRIKSPKKSDKGDKKKS